VLISSHRLEEIEALQSQALLLDKGRIKYSGDLQTLRERWETPQVELVFGDADVAAQAAARLAGSDLEVTVDGARLLCLLPHKGGVGVVFAQLGALSAAIHHVREIPMPLRDLIARLYNPGSSETAEAAAPVEPGEPELAGSGRHAAGAS